MFKLGDNIGICTRLTDYYLQYVTINNDLFISQGLADNMLGHRGAEEMCKMLQENVTLRYLDLSGNYLVVFDLQI